MPWWDSRDDRSTAAAALVGVVVGSLITGGVSYAIAHQSLTAQRERQAAEFAERRDSETREKREKVYTAFLDTSIVWRTTLGDEIACYKLKAAEPCGKSDQQVEDDVDGFRGAFSNVYIFGSIEAIERAKALADELPYTFPGVGGRVDASKASIDAQAYADEYDLFEDLMCRELPVQPRTDC